MTRIKIKNALIKKSVGITSLVAVIVAVGLGGFYLSDSKTSARAESKLSEKSHIFEFAGAQGWWQGATNHNSMALFDSNEKRECFVSSEFKQGIVNVSSEYTRREAEVKGVDSGYTISQASTSQGQINTLSGTKQYTINNYSITGGVQPTKRGFSLGYIQLADGYVQTLSWCDEPSQLHNTLPAINAVKINK